ncbi:MAG: hypothetical protein E7555_03295 [Ruminococcaceae bacterium]|nr:hypothetical protein [Oscillospiraceae bacterium]
MRKKFKEWFSIQLAKNPGRMVLAVIFIFNVLFFVISALIISGLSLEGTEKMGFLEATFCTATMILDAGCIQFVVADIGKAGVATVIICLLIVLVGMVSFTGAVIGYITNYISNFIENANAGTRKLNLSDHVVILNWNTRASEIINDLLYCEEKQKVVVLVSDKKAEIEKEIHERISDTILREHNELMEKSRNMSFFKKMSYIRKNVIDRKVSVIVREGDVFSSKQLRDISVEEARIVIILGNDINNNMCRFETKERLEKNGKGNSQTIKTLMQVADMTADESSADDQKIIVEITDDWTLEVVEKIIKSKQVDGKCNIVPVKVNQVLGNILAQFSLMPELNLVYKELFSNKGAAFYSQEKEKVDDIEYVREYLKTHKYSIPLTFMEDSKGNSHAYYVAEKEKHINKFSVVTEVDKKFKINPGYNIEQKNIVILGHNSRCEDIMKGFAGFEKEWEYKDSDKKVLRIVVIDEKEHLEKMDYYKKYPFVIETVAAEIYDKDIILETLDRFVVTSTEDTSVLILSDDTAMNEDIDVNALANLIYVQDIINDKKAKDPDFDEESIDVIVEIINPKHHDIVNNYSVNNVVISNRYISKMITQIGEKEALFDFYTDILTYDDGTFGTFESKEVYIKKAQQFFGENNIPGTCNAQQFIRALFEASIDESIPEEHRYPTIALGYVKPGGKVVLFSGDQASIDVTLEERDKLIVFSNH